MILIKLLKNNKQIKLKKYKFQLIIKLKKIKYLNFKKKFLYIKKCF